MKILKIFFATPILYLISLSAGTQLSSCMKTVTVHDTTIRAVHDTTIRNIHDTTIRNIHDTVYDINDDLVAYYNFNGGNLNDSSGNGNNIAFNNATPTSDRFGNPNNAFLFDGVSSYMRVPNSTTLNPNSITLMAIVKFNDFYHGPCSISQLIMKGSQDQDQGTYGMRVAPDGICTSTSDTSMEKILALYGDYSNRAYVMDTNYFVKAGHWVTIWYTFDGHTSNIYIDGNLSFTSQSSAQFNANSYDLYIGKTQNPSFPYLFNGVIDEIRIYNEALSASAIKQFQNSLH
jgi:Concanavalin A-like lectin/glucanases superfamily